jgi:hypothetical protein
MEPNAELLDEKNMAMIKCSECDKDISDTAVACVGCGAPMAVAAAKSDQSSMFDLTGLKTAVSSATARVKESAESVASSDSGSKALTSLRSALSTVTAKVKESAESAAEQGKDLMKSKQQRDAEAVERLASQFGEKSNQPASVSVQACSRFNSALGSTIDVKFAEVMSGKTDANKFLTYVDSQILTATVRNVFKNALGVVPPQVEAACKMSEAILAPSALEREQLIKSAVGIGGGAAGIGMIIAGIGGALGWGAGVIASVSAFFVGTSMAGPVGWAIAGITLAGTAAYFATTSNETKDTERFMNVLKSSTGRSVEAIWPEYEAALVKVLDSESAS